jgi:hypothetical protein
VLSRVPVRGEGGERGSRGWGGGREREREKKERESERAREREGQGAGAVAGRGGGGGETGSPRQEAEIMVLKVPLSIGPPYKISSWNKFLKG